MGVEVVDPDERWPLGGEVAHQARCSVRYRRRILNRLRAIVTVEALIEFARACIAGAADLPATAAAYQASVMETTHAAIVGYLSPLLGSTRASSTADELFARLFGPVFVRLLLGTDRGVDEAGLHHLKSTIVANFEAVGLQC